MYQYRDFVLSFFVCSRMPTLRNRWRKKMVIELLFVNMFACVLKHHVLHVCYSLAICVCFRCWVLSFAEYIFQLKEDADTASVERAKRETLFREKDSECMHAVIIFNVCIEPHLTCKTGRWSRTPEEGAGRGKEGSSPQGILYMYLRCVVFCMW